MQRQGSLAMVSPCSSSSKQITHSPLVSVKTSSANSSPESELVKSMEEIHATLLTIVRETRFGEAHNKVTLYVIWQNELGAHWTFDT